VYYVYVLYSKKLKHLYKGSTGNLRNRLAEHNSGAVVSTKFGKPWELLYYEAFQNKTDALIEEKFLKSGKGRQRLDYLLKNALMSESARG